MMGRRRTAINMTEPMGDGAREGAAFQRDARGNVLKRDSGGRIFVLLPALNEEEAIGNVLRRIPRRELEALGYNVNVWVVDGNSTDRTHEIIAELGARLFVQKGRGKGNGMRQAFAHFLEDHHPADAGTPQSDLFLMLDADGTYPPEDIPTFVSTLTAGNDVVLGSRFLGRIEDGAMTPLNAIGNRVLSIFARLLYGVSVTDVCTGMWGFCAQTLRRLELTAQGFDLEADLFGSLCLANARIAELPIFYGARIGEPKLLPIRTGWQIAWRLLLKRLNGPTRLPTQPAAESVQGRGTTA